MSTYNQYTKHPRTGLWENALWEDDHFGHYHYGVIFPNGDIFDPWKKSLTTTINAFEAGLLNDEIARRAF
jgi:hypothetical protein